ncbi:hypothetical protein, partial [Pseudomonas sp.]|uniref:hypothetical protein n=1 Tax=Pseudomonas sp. TaxID=306 RepID=UPI003FD7CF7B
AKVVITISEAASRILWLKRKLLFMASSVRSGLHDQGLPFSERARNGHYFLEGKPVIPPFP